MHVDRALLQKYNVPGPRYTSYPTAAHFGQEVDADAVREALVARRDEERPLSLYVHLPFCRRMCWYCACTKIITRDDEARRRYIDYLIDEIALKAEILPRRDVVQLHFGGGTPTYLDPADLRRLGRALHDAFDFHDGGEFSVEIDPREVTPEHAAVLREIGFNRASLGVQDHDPKVQKAVNRIQPLEMTQGVVDLLRATGFGSINLDLIYGLPYQTVDSFRTTLHQTLDMAPERLAIYGYAHVPWVVPAQKLLESKALPSAEVKLEMLAMIIEELTAAGYDHIGMDHFARPDDELAVALREGKLQRNFQGYSTWAGTEIQALGMSAISQTDELYFQNAKELPAYYTRVGEGRLPVARGVRLTADDRLRRETIMAVMCRGRIDYGALSRELGVDDLRGYFADAIASLDELEADGLVVRHLDALEVTSTGRLFLRNIAMSFDAYLGDATRRYSMTV